MARSLPPGDEPWQTFHVRVRVTRGRAEVYADVALSAVTGVVGSTTPRPRPIWQGVVARRTPEQPVTPDWCATLAAAALGHAFPTLF